MKIRDLITQDKATLSFEVFPPKKDTDFAEVEAAALGIADLKPDYMSILVGVNDVWHEFSNHNGVDPEKFEKIYCMLIEELTANLPGIKLMLLEPFVLPGSATCDTEEFPDKYRQFSERVKINAETTKRVAAKYSVPFVPLQNKFDEACKAAEPSYWLVDGVHPSACGHEIIKREWLRTFAESF